jgi:hypothetical protein
MEDGGWKRESLGRRRDWERSRPGCGSVRPRAELERCVTRKVAFEFPARCLLRCVLKTKA